MGIILNCNICDLLLIVFHVLMHKKILFSLPSSVCVIQCHVAMATVGPSKLLHRRPPAETENMGKVYV